MTPMEHPSQSSQQPLASVPDLACTFCGRDASGPLAANITVGGVKHPFCCTDHGILWTTSLRHQLTRS